MRSFVPGPCFRRERVVARLHPHTGVHIERARAAYRAATIIALLYLLWVITPTVWPHVVTYGQLVAGSARASRAANADRNKLRAPALESMLLQSGHFPADSEPHCQPLSREWDYVCSYIPTPLQSRARLHFGVNVDSQRWIKVSSIVAEGTPVPAPQ